MHETSPDAIDSALGADPGDPRFALRRRRPEFVSGAETCRQSVLTPKDDLGLAPTLRAALARRMVMQNDDSVLLAQYDDIMQALDPSADENALAFGVEPEILPAPLDAIARHADLVTIKPGEASADDIKLLADAGLTNPQIVALSELISFANFQTRIIAGLRLLGPGK